MHHFYERFDLLGIRLGHDAVPQVEDVPRSPTGLRENVGSAPPQRFPIGQQRHRVKIPLHSPIVTDGLPACRELNKASL